MPIYETERDRLNESIIANKVATCFIRYGVVSPMKNPRGFRWDYSFVDEQNNIKFFAEMKTRSNKFYDFPYFDISLSKYLSGRELTDKTGVPCYFFVDFAGVIYYCMLHNFNRSYGYVWGGRTDTENDMEPMLRILMDEFIKLN